MISLPFFKQHTNYTCGPATIEMVLAFLGDKRSEKSLARDMHTNASRGTRHQAMIEEAISQGFYCYVNSQASIYEMMHYIAQGFPVIVDFVESSTNTGHYAVVVGGSGNSIILNDPWNGEHIRYSKHNFQKRWHDPLTKSRGWMMVISKGDFHLGKQYKPVSK